MNVTKRQVADHLLDAAAVALLDQSDPITAIVLGGSAEDIYWGLLERERPGAEPAREEIARHVIEVTAALFPNDQRMTLKAARNAIRSTFNWLRHNDDPDEAQSREWDAQQEAAAIVERAMENLFRLTGSDHPRYQELLTHSLGRG
ncbi:hypothetical protein [Roseateles puraquae]|uniref:Uncharacterized protein n=1 Tax=Roseateles puraquae TaxID=431059 RepID=A0A254N2L4_9BURK|nr:hypothetical protein [Roseateles puraquae]MDG0856360.1 hypothetical protein [Roseateles puraquae]OWR02411.1 hypothetical protein CDO81_19675 [Roseateles puraquae]